MPTQHRMRVIYGQVAWMLGTVLSLSLLGILSYELFFVLSVIGLLIVVEVTAPVTVTPQWRWRLPWLILAGLVGFVAVVIRRLIEILPPEAVGL